MSELRRKMEFVSIGKTNLLEQAYAYEQAKDHVEFCEEILRSYTPKVLLEKFKEQFGQDYKIPMTRFLIIVYKLNLLQANAMRIGIETQAANDSKDLG